MQILTPEDIDFGHYLTESEAGERVRPSTDYLDATMHVLSPAADRTKHPTLPFLGAHMEFTPGEVTAWAGFNGSGKSMLQGQVLTNIAMLGHRVCIASFEMKPEKTLARIGRQVYGTPHPTRPQMASFLERFGQNIWLYDQQGTVQPDRMIAVVKHCAEKLGVSHVAIDSLMKCVRGEDDYNGQKDFVDALTAAARDYKVHIHLVHHLRKGDTDERMPTRMDMKGSGAVSDLVDNVLLVWRNKRKERDRDAGRSVNDDDPDSVLICDKQRNGEWEGRVKLWYDKDSLKFSDLRQRGPR